jgi:hypothetical protein
MPPRRIQVPSKARKVYIPELDGRLVKGTKKTIKFTGDLDAAIQKVLKKIPGRQSGERRR